MNQVERDYDVLIIGAGLSGISAAHHLQTHCPNKTYAILEARDKMGGTWDLFKYPGIRSDSDMYTLGYSFKPWTDGSAIADGPAILKYINETATDGGIDKKIKYNSKVTGASWDTSTSTWTIEVAQGELETTKQYTCNFFFACVGYYDYDEGYTPDFEGVNDFSGTFVHPQKWTNEIEYEDKKVVVIGSGATAVTLVPEMAKKAEKVTMLQRTPTYMSIAPRRDRIANFLRRILPNMWAYNITRWKNVTIGTLFYNACKKWPKTMKKILIGGVQKQLGENYPIGKDFNPPYNPWEQRLCLIPDNDLFEAMNEGKAEIVTDHVKKFNKKGIELKSGAQLDADLVVSATGLKLIFLGGIELEVDGKVINPSDLLTYRGMMFKDVPNLALAFGYTNASWTLKCDLTCAYVCRLVNHMDKKAMTYCVPRLHEAEMEIVPFVDFNSGYILRSIDDLPKQGAKKPWKLYQNYLKDILSLRYNSLQDGTMEFGK